MGTLMGGPGFIVPLTVKWEVGGRPEVIMKYEYGEIFALVCKVLSCLPVIPGVCCGRVPPPVEEKEPQMLPSLL